MASIAIKKEPEWYEERDRICRLCMSEEAFDDVFRDENLHHWISEFLAIKISNDDGMSRSICAICRLRLTEFNNFRIGCLEVQEVLRRTVRTESEFSNDSVTPKASSSQEKSYLDDDDDDLDGNPAVFQDNEMENDPGLMEDSIVVEDVKIEPRIDEDETQASNTSGAEEDHSETGSKCQICDKVLSSRSKLARHCQSLRHWKRVLEVQANKTTATGNLKQPIRSDSDRFDSVEKLMTREENDEGFMCSICGQTFNRPYQLTKHMTTHNVNESPTSPETSGMSKNYSFSSAMDQQKNTDDEQVYQSDTCEKVHSNISKLTSHASSVIKSIEIGTNIAIEESQLISTTSDIPTKVGKAASEERPFQCDLCPKTFQFRRVLVHHKSKVHGPKRHKCDICNKKFPSRCEMIRHEYTKKHLRNLEKIHRQQNEQSLHANVQSHETDSVQPNDQMSEDEDGTTGSVHADSSANEKSYEGTSLLKNKRLLAKYSEQLVKVKCDVCNKVLANKWTLLNHKKSHDPSNNCTCHVCGRPCRNLSTLRNHLVTHKSVVERQRIKPPEDKKNVPRPFKCDICQTTYAAKFTFLNHKRVIHGPKNYQCEMCGFKLSTNEVLEKHMQKHILRGHTKEDFQALKELMQKMNSSTNSNEEDAKTDRSAELSENENSQDISTKSEENCSELPTEQSFQCDVCHKSFETRVLLYRHKRNVHKPKRFKCSVCGKCFAYKQQKNMHMQVHKQNSTATKDFECPECPKIFPSWKHLHKHLIFHVSKKKSSGERTVACPKCDKMFQTSAHRDSHMRIAHKNVEHKCDICNKSFSMRAQLWKHMNNEHGEKSASSSESDGENSFQGNNSYEAGRKQPQRNAKHRAVKQETITDDES